MRVIAGTARRLPLKAPFGMNTRPTSDQIKETLFNMIQGDVAGAYFLDLFAGSGALGIESLSRGARKCTFCDKSYKAIQMIKENLIKTKMEHKSIIVNKDYKKCIENLNEKFDLIFIDPPYKKNIAIDSVKKIIENDLLAIGGIIIIETDEEKREEDELKDISKLEVYDKRKYGRVTLLLLRERG